MSSSVRSSQEGGLTKIGFSVADVSGQDNEHPSTELNCQDPATSCGWQSPRDCDYPQTIVLKCESNECTLDQVQILSHESKIATKIEIFVAQCGSDNSAQATFDDCVKVQRLGRVSLASNERSNYQERETKSVKIDSEPVTFVKLIIHDCHKNKYNVFNQVGIISIQLWGIIQVSNGEDPASPVQTKHGNQASTLTESVTKTHASPPLLLNSRQPLSSRIYDPDIQSRLDLLDRKKKELANAEDFEAAARVKSALNTAKSMFSSLPDLSERMRNAAAEEDYTEASRLKFQRKETSISAHEALKIAEQCAFGDKERPMRPAIERLQDTFQNSPSPILAKQKSSSNTNPRDVFPGTKDYPDPQEDDSKSFEETESNDDKKRSLNNSSVRDGAFFPPGDHPLEDVPGFQDLPSPEEVKDSSGKSKDLIRMVETILGSYRTKCFFSRDWILRDAALTKMSMMLPNICTNHPMDDSAPILCKMMERALDDRNVNVFLTSLIVLEESLTEFERSNMPSKSVIPKVEKITVSLLGRLGDNNKKVVEGSENALMSFALSQCIGPSFTVNQALKNTRERDLKAGRAVCSRLRFLQKLVDKFGEQTIGSDRVMSFVKGPASGFTHRDQEVRVAVRELTTSIYLKIGDRVFGMMDGLSAKQLQEYKMSFGAAVRRQNQTSSILHAQQGSDLRLSSPLTAASTLRASPHFHHDGRGDLRGKISEQRAAKAPPRGRGRGRSTNPSKLRQNRLGDEARHGDNEDSKFHRKISNETWLDDGQYEDG